MDFLMSAPQQFFQKSAGGVFTPVFSATLAQNNGLGNFTIVTLFNGPFSKSGSQVRLTLQSGPAVFNTSDLWLGHRGVGNLYNFDGTQVRVTVGGTNVISIPSNTTIVADAMPYNFIAANDFCVASFSTGAGSNAASQQPVTGTTEFFSSSGVNEASLTTKANTYGSSAQKLDLINKIEVFG